MSREYKRKRGTNFTEEEESVLMELFKKNRSILESKKSDVATWKQKKRAWQEMVDTFYTLTGIRREWTALRVKFLNMKRKAKTENGENMAHNIRRNTGKIVDMTRGSTDSAHQFDSDTSNVPNDISYAQSDDTYESSADAHDLDSLSTHKEVKQEFTNFDWRSLNPRTLRSLDEEKIKLVLIQQDFNLGQNKRAQEKHDHELIKEKFRLDQEVLEGKLRIEMMELDILEKRARLDLK